VTDDGEILRGRILLAIANVLRGGRSRIDLAAVLVGQSREAQVVAVRSLAWHLLVPAHVCAREDGDVDAAVADSMRRRDRSTSIADDWVVRTWLGITAGPRPAPPELAWDELGAWAANAAALAVPTVADAALGGWRLALQRSLVLALLEHDTLRAARLCRWLWVARDGDRGLVREARGELRIVPPLSPMLAFELALLAALAEQP